MVTTRLDGAAPEEVETDISDKIESAVNTISGIDELRSTSNQGISQIVIQFFLEKDVDVAAQDVRDKINAILPDLPKGIDPPIVSKIDFGAAPVLLVAVESDKTIREASEIADKQVRRQIESITGVGQVSLIGGQNRQINVWLNPIALRGNLRPHRVRTCSARWRRRTSPPPPPAAASRPVRKTSRPCASSEGADSPEALGRIVVREERRSRRFASRTWRASRTAASKRRPTPRSIASARSSSRSSSSRDRTPSRSSTP